MRGRGVLIALGILCALCVAGAAWYLLKGKSTSSTVADNQDAPVEQRGGDDEPEDSGTSADSDEASPLAGETADPEEAADPDLPWGPSSSQFAAAQEAASRMSDSELAGQVIISHWSGTDPKTAERIVRDQHLAGIILMGGNIDTAGQIQEVSAGVQNEQRKSGRTWPAIVSVDQEGGRVSRLAGVIDAVPAFSRIAEGGPKEITKTYGKMAQQMAELGFTMDFAPIADVSIGPQDPTIGDRAAGTDAAEVAEAVPTAVAALLSHGVVPVIKHFPGHGSVTTDSHVEVPVQARSFETLREKDFVPFRAAVDSGAPVVMMGHIALREIDENTPATVAPGAYQLLREELDFDGVITTDAMNMAAITNSLPTGEETVAALAAGADLVLMPADVVAAHTAATAALEDGELDRARVEESAARVIALQMWQANLRAES